MGILVAIKDKEKKYSEQDITKKLEEEKVLYNEKTGTMDGTPGNYGSIYYSSHLNVFVVYGELTKDERTIGVSKSFHSRPEEKHLNPFFKKIPDTIEEIRKLFPDFNPEYVGRIPGDPKVTKTTKFVNEGTSNDKRLIEIISNWEDYLKKQA